MVTYNAASFYDDKIVDLGKEFGSRTDDVGPDLNTILQTADAIIVPPEANYLLETTVNVRRAVTWLAYDKGLSEANGSMNGQYEGHFYWGGAAGETMFDWGPSDITTNLAGGGIVGTLILDGNDLAGMGVRQFNCRAVWMDVLKVQKVRDIGYLFEYVDTSDTAQVALGPMGNVYEYGAGSDANTQNSKGLVTSCHASAAKLVTNMAYQRIETNMGNGASAVGVAIGSMDNAWIAQIKGWFRDNDTAPYDTAGPGLYLIGSESAKYGLTDQPAVSRKNYFGQVNGVNVEFGEGTYHNDLGPTTHNEKKNITVDPTAVAHYHVEDRQGKGRWATFNEFRMWDELWVPGSEFARHGGWNGNEMTALALISGGPTIASVVMRDGESANSNRHSAMILPRDWSDGTISRIDVYTMTSEGAAGAAGDVRYVLQLGEVGSADGSSVSTDEDLFTFDNAQSGTAGEMNVFSWTAIGRAYTEGDIILLRIERNGTDAADTSTMDDIFLGVKIHYRADGPAGTSAGAGETFDTGLRRLP